MSSLFTRKHIQSLAATAAGLCVFAVILVGLQLQLASPTSALSSLPGRIITKIDPFTDPKPHAAEPVRLMIPSVEIDTSIEKVGLTKTGEMDVPKDYDKGGWFEPGTKPGEEGNAVIAGHLDSKTDMAAFWNLKKVQPGDDIYVEDAEGITHHFRAERLETYDADNAPLLEIFGKTDGVHLNLITCGGTWNKSTGKYEKRTVVYAKIVES